MTDTFAIDIDDTLYSFCDNAREALLKLYDETEDKSYLRSAYAVWDEWRSPPDICGLDTWMQVIEMVHQPEVILQQTPFSGAVKTLNALADEGFNLMYISNRDIEATDATAQWLMIHGFPAGDLVCMMTDKAAHMGHCRYMIDDRPKTLINFIYDSEWPADMFGERKAMSLLYPFNRALSDIPNIFLAPSWAGLSSWFFRKGFISKPAHQALEV